MSIKDLEYKDFSLKLHTRRGHKPTVCQIELTYRCPLRCRHCYTDCYNTPAAKKDELTTSQVKLVLDKCKEAGVIWLCFTGGDPLIREDFVELYEYAKSLGFITTIFSSLASLNEKTFAALRNSPPFGIETTLNAATPRKYEEVTGTALFGTQLSNIKKALEAGIEVKVKTQVTEQNRDELEQIKDLVISLDLKFKPSSLLHARLDHGTLPCRLRLAPEEAVAIIKKYGQYDEETTIPPGARADLKDRIEKPATDKLLTCAAGGDSFWVNTRGRMLICANLRTFDHDLLREKSTVTEGFYTLNEKVHSLRFRTDSKCRDCSYRAICKWCPGRAYLETKDLESPIEHFCRLTAATLEANGISSSDVPI